MMTAEQLKAAILQLAMQGKLVPQDPNDEPASVLLEKIAEKKKKLIKEGKIKKEKILPAITKDEIPFDIPDNWKWVKLSEIIYFRMGKTPPRAEIEYWSNDVPWVSIADMVNGSTISETKEMVSNEAIAKKFGGQITPKGTMIMSFKLTIGKVSILGIDAVHNEAIISIIPFINDNFITRNYLMHVLPYLSTFGSSKKAIMGFTLNSSSLSNLLIPLPPLEEQKRIVAKIEELIPFVEQYADASKKLNLLNENFPDQLKKSILEQAVQGKLVPQDPADEPTSILLEKIAKEKEKLIKEGKIKKQKSLPPITEDEIPFDIPDNWKWTRIGELFQHNTGKALNGSNKVGNVMTYITTSNLYWNNFKIDNLKSMPFREDELKKYTITKGDLLVCEGGDYGRTAIWNFDYDIRFQNHIHRLRAYLPLCTKYFYYVMYFLKTSDLINGKGITIQGLSSGTLHNLIIPLPPLEEQKRIVAKIEELMPLIEEFSKA